MFDRFYRHRFVVKTLKMYSRRNLARLVKILDPFTGVIFKFQGARVGILLGVI